MAAQTLNAGTTLPPPGAPVAPKAYPRFLPVGDAALSVEFGDAINPDLNARVVALDIALAAAEFDGIIETVPSYRSLLICYDPVLLSWRQLAMKIRRLLEGRLLEDDTGTGMPRAAAVTWSVPVVYGPPYGDDLPEVAARLAMPEAEIIRIHSGAEYLVYMVGFAPGLPYMGPLPDTLHISRRQSPRPSVPAGAVMIGGMQAGIVPMPVPSAWYMLGRTPLRLFDLSRHDPFLVRAGDRVRFRRIDAAEFERLAALDPDLLLPQARTPP